MAFDNMLSFKQVSRGLLAARVATLAGLTAGVVQGG